MKYKIMNYIKRTAFYVLSHFSDYAPSPRDLSIEITDDCNLNCLMCPRRFARITGKNMSFERFKFILDQLPKVKHVILLGRGETLMCPDLFKILEFGKSRNMHFTIVTNGILLTEKNINRLSGVSRVIVSIDHPQVEGYKKIRGANLEVIIDNLRRLKQIKKDVYLCIQGLIMEENIEVLPEFITLAQSVNADEVNLIHLIAFDQKLDKKHGDNFELELKLRLRETEQKAKQEKTSFIATPLLKKPRHCFEPWTTPRISLNGDIYPCCYIYETSEPIWKEWYQGVCLNVPQYQYKMGNVFEDSFKRIWAGSDYQLVRKIVRKSEIHNLLSSEEIKRKRKENILNGRFSYCTVCIYRQNRAC